MFLLGGDVYQLVAHGFNSLLQLICLDPNSRSIVVGMYAHTAALELFIKGYDDLVVGIVDNAKRRYTALHHI